ncbi:hypothetical protein [Nodularia sphaerocarpa]|nr:hypothetical protein [Nodularia sphaerocarpa]MDB9374829.1 hypothetical protein [Nodularia sphaerocarpa CS-585]MDB9376645.1 hypothetical protein [Nodularia sphaerocarpa CS-585A2]ULP70509.1 hypothetical protein BDGGKGIB_00125 [Nodularia sphaerocarpa UHCC 0038]
MAGFEPVSYRHAAALRVELATPELDFLIWIVLFTLVYILTLF